MIVPQARQTEIGLCLGKARVIARTELAEMETAAAAALAQVRSRVTVGGAGRLAAFLSAAPDDVRGRLLDDVATRDAAMADAARGAMVVFADLGPLTDKSVRRVVTGIDPWRRGHRTGWRDDGVRETVLDAVSKRLRGDHRGRDGGRAGAARHGRRGRAPARRALHVPAAHARGARPPRRMRSQMIALTLARTRGRGTGKAAPAAKNGSGASAAARRAQPAAPAAEEPVDENAVQPLDAETMAFL